MTRHRFGPLQPRLPALPRGAGQGAPARWWAHLALVWLVLALVATVSDGYEVVSATSTYVVLDPSSQDGPVVTLTNPVEADVVTAPGPSLKAGPSP